MLRIIIKIRLAGGAVILGPDIKNHAEEYIKYDTYNNEKKLKKIWIFNKHYLS